MLCYVMLCYVMLCYVVLYYIIFYYIILYYIILYYMIIIYIETRDPISDSQSRRFQCVQLQFWDGHKFLQQRSITINLL